MIEKISNLMLILCVVAVGSCQTTTNSKKAGGQFRDYANAPAHVKQFYQSQHQNQTLDFAKSQAEQILKIMSSVKDADDDTLSQLERDGVIRRLSIWDAVLELDKLIDESDPDFSLPNSVHALQTAEAIRRDLPKVAKKMGLPKEELDWFILVGLLHDIGKIDALLRVVPQWAVVGDSFPLGLPFSEHNIFHDYFKDNPDNLDPRYNTGLGVYRPYIGLNNLVMSFGHDEFAYQVLAKLGSLPKAALSMIRFHSFYPLHQKNAYLDLLEPADFEEVAWVREFSPYDLYSKHEETISVSKLEPFYKKLINKYFPPKPGEDELKVAWPILQPVG